MILECDNFMILYSWLSCSRKNHVSEGFRLCIAATKNSIFITRNVVLRKFVEHKKVKRIFTCGVRFLNIHNIPWLFIMLYFVLNLSTDALLRLMQRFLCFSVHSDLKFGIYVDSESKY